MKRIKMAKQSRAKIKMTQAKIAREAAARREAKANERNSPASNSEVDFDAYASVDGAWVELGLAAPARRALIDEGLYKVSDLRKYSLDAIKDLHGMGPNAIRILITAMKKSDISFRK
jgi:DNA-nicking Smr family endonuclease